MKPKRYPYSGKKKGSIVTTIDQKQFSKISLEAIRGISQAIPLS